QEPAPAAVVVVVVGDVLVPVLVAVEPDSANSEYAMIAACWPGPPGKLPTAISVSPSIATGELVPAGSCCCQTILPVFVFIAISLPLNVVVNTRSLLTVADPYGLDGSFVSHRTLPVF